MPALYTRKCQPHRRSSARRTKRTKRTKLTKRMRHWLYRRTNAWRIPPGKTSYLTQRPLLRHLTKRPTKRPRLGAASGHLAEASAWGLGGILFACIRWRVRAARRCAAASAAAPGLNACLDDHLGRLRDEILTGLRDQIRPGSAGITQKQQFTAGPLAAFVVGTGAASVGTRAASTAGTSEAHHD